MRTVDVSEARTQLPGLIAAVEAGEDVVIARDGVPAVKLVPMPLPPVRDREGGWLQGQIEFVDPEWDKTDPALASAFYANHQPPEV